MWIIDLKHTQKYYGIRITLREAVQERDRPGEENQKLECGCCVHCVVMNIKS
jgi:hypothetical protein